MKAHPETDIPPGRWSYEIKFDGFRAVAMLSGRSVALRSRNDNDLSPAFPDIVQALRALPLSDAVLDGEIVALDESGLSSFQLLQNVGSLPSDRLIYYVFDLLRLDGDSWIYRPLEERQLHLAQLLHQPPSGLRLSTPLGEDGALLLEHARHLGLEGLIGKRPGSLYEPGRRSGAWIKLKILKSQEFVIGGYTQPEGNRPAFGALLVGVQRDGALIFSGKVGTGFDSKQLRSLHAQFQTLRRNVCPFANLPEKRRGRYGAGLTRTEMKRCVWLDPILVCQVKYTAWTEDEKLRHPVFLGLRTDRKPADIRREPL